MDIQENIPLAPKTTLRIGGSARFYAEIHTKEDIEDAQTFAHDHNIPLIVLGAGSNTIFADGIIDALVVRITHDTMTIDDNRITVGAGKPLAQVIMEAAEHDLDLSTLTGIPGTIGGAVFGNAGQGYNGMWIDNFIESVEISEDGKWKTMTKDECDFGYRSSIFKKPTKPAQPAKLIFSIILTPPSRSTKDILADVEKLLQKRIETQPHRKTAGSVFLSKSADTPAWKLIDAAGLRGKTIGGITISQKHANFFQSDDHATFEDVQAMINEVRSVVDEPLTVEMRLIKNDGTTNSH